MYIYILTFVGGRANALIGPSAQPEIGVHAKNLTGQCRCDVNESWYPSAGPRILHPDHSSYESALVVDLGSILLIESVLVTQSWRKFKDDNEYTVRTTSTILGGRKKMCIKELKNMTDPPPLHPYRRRYAIPSIAIASPGDDRIPRVDLFWKNN